MQKDIVKIGDVYGKMLNTLRYNINESNKSAFGDLKLAGGGAKGVDGYREALNDEKDADQNIYNKKKKKMSVPTEDIDNEKELSESKKNNIKILNKFMSKSVFDKLYNKVLRENFGQDEDAKALGVTGAPDSEGGDFGDEGFGDDEDFGDEEGFGDEVTITLDKETAKKLINLLQVAVGGEVETEDEGEDEGEGEDDLDFGDEESYEEDEEEEKVSKSSKLQGQSNKVSGFPQPKKDKASSDVTDDVGSKDGAPPISALQGKNNKVPGSSIKPKDYFFQ